MEIRMKLSPALLQLLARLAHFLESNTDDEGISIGRQNSAESGPAFCTGRYARATHYGARAHAAGQFAQAGDQQIMTLILKGQSSGATPINLTLPDGSQPTIDQLTSWQWTASLVCRRTDATGKSGAAVAHGGLHRDTTAASTRLVGANSVAHYQFDSAYAVSITADTTNAALQVQCTGIVTHTVNWVCVLTIVQTKATV